MFAASKSGSAADPTDAQFPYVTMLLHGDGTNGAQNNTFLDSSTNNFTITRNGNTTQGTFTPYGSNWSNYLDGSSFLSFPYTSNYEWTASDFTVEAWVFPTSLTNWSYNNAGYLHSTMIGNHSSTGVQDTWSFGPLSDGRVGFYYYSGGQQAVYSTATISANQWSHVAMTKTSSGITIFVNGVGTTATAVTGTPATDNYGMVIGKSNNTTLNGYVSNARIVKGTAVYSGTSYTVPTAPLTAITNTQFLSCQSNRFIDNSTNAATITVNGSPSVQRFNPFGTSTAYSTSVIGGSGYFDGSGDYLSVADNSAFNLNGVSFTVECWVYWNSVSGEQNIAEQFTGPSGPGWTLYKFNSSTGSPAGSIDFYGSSGSINSGVTPVAGQWYHLAISRNNSTGTTSFYVNGTRTATATFGVGSSASTALLVGVRNGGTTWFNGYMEDLRVVKGSYVYDPTATTITVPTTPLTAITNTSLLLSYTNAGILDNAMMNDLETVGNAQISTSVKKYGTGSMYFDGSGDYLTAPSNPAYNLGSGSFTVEFWLYPNTITIPNPDNESWLVARTNYSSDIGWSVFQANQQIRFRIGNTGGTIATGNVITATTWQHIAVVRSGSTISIYVNGTSQGSGTNSSFTDASTVLVVGGITATTGWNGNKPLDGYIDELRISKVARYTTTFTPPTAAFPNN